MCVKNVLYCLFKGEIMRVIRHIHDTRTNMDARVYRVGSLHSRIVVRVNGVIKWRETLNNATIHIILGLLFLDQEI